MKKYTFVVDAVISLHVDVEAASLEEATGLAKEAPIMSLCHQCSEGERGEWNTSGELDTDPTAASLAEAYQGDQDVLNLAKELW